MKNTFLSATAVIILALIVSCVTNWPRTMPTSNPNANKLTDIPETDVTAFGITGDSEAEKLATEAYIHMLKKEWKQAAETLWSASQTLDEENSVHFLKSLVPFMFLPSCDNIIDTLALQQPDNRDIQIRKEIYSKYPQSMEWTEDPVVLPWLEPLPEDERGYATLYHPMVEVIVNGVTLRLCMDTGIPSTLIFSDAFEKTGLELYSENPIDFKEMMAPKVSFATAVAPNVELGSLKMQNIPMIITERPQLWVDSWDGMIGWPKLSQMVMEMDSREKTITLYSSYKEETGPDNLFWIGVPVVSLMGGAPRDIILFGLDTGADTIWFNEAGLQKNNSEIMGRKQTKRARIGEKQHKWSDVINLSGLFLDGSELVFENYINDGMESNFPGSHGCLGSEIAQAGKVRINYPEGRLVFEPYPSE